MALAVVYHQASREPQRKVSRGREQHFLFFINWMATAALDGPRGGGKASSHQVTPGRAASDQEALNLFPVAAARQTSTGTSSNSRLRCLQVHASRPSAATGKRGSIWLASGSLLSIARRRGEDDMLFQLQHNRCGRVEGVQGAVAVHQDKGFCSEATSAMRAAHGRSDSGSDKVELMTAN